MADPQYGALVVPHTYAYAPATARIEILGRAAAQHGKIACAVWLTQHLEGPGAHRDRAEPARCPLPLDAPLHGRARAVAPPRRLAARRARPRAAAEPTQAPRDAPPRCSTRAPNATLTEREGKEVLALYGVPVVRDIAGAAAPTRRWPPRSDCGMPVVLKVESPDIPHKTEAGVIRLNVRTEAEVRERLRGRDAQRAGRHAAAAHQRRAGAADGAAGHRDHGRRARRPAVRPDGRRRARRRVRRAAEGHGGAPRAGGSCAKRAACWAS